MRGEKLRYIHRNPVKRGLVEKLEDWKWSSFGTMRVGKKVSWRLSHNGRRESGSEWGFIQRSEDANQPELSGLRTERERPGHPSSNGVSSQDYVGGISLK